MLAGGRILKPSLSDGRYPAVKLRKDGASKDHKVHILVMRAFVGTPPPSMEVNHRDGDKTNARLSNLEYKTHQQNMLHAHATGLLNFAGDGHPASVLSESEVRTIYRRRHNGEKLSALSSDYGVSEQLIYQIATGKAWKHLNLKGQQNVATT